MALSKSIQKGQAVVTCQLCEESTDLKWKCMTCDHWMCSKCKAIHLKVKSVNDHEIVNIKNVADYMLNAQKEPDFTILECQVHKGKFCCVFCNLCQEIICPLCIAQTHNKHEMLEIKEGYDIFLKHAKTQKSDFEKESVQIVEDVSRLDSTRKSNISKFENEKTKIRKHQDAFKADIDRQATEYLEDININQTKAEEIFANEVKQNKQAFSDLESRKNRISDAIDSTNASVLFTTVKEFRKLGPTTRTTAGRNVSISLPKFIPGDLNESTNKSIFGDLKQVKTEKLHNLVISRLTDIEINYLKSVESNHPVEMTIDQGNSDVILEGVIDDLMNAKQDVYDALRKFGRSRAEAEIIKEQVQWYFKDFDAGGHPVLSEYPDMINMYLETAYRGESGRTEVEFMDDHGVEYVIVIKDMKEYVKNDRNNEVDIVRREKIPVEGVKFDIPPEWDEQGTDNVKVVTLINTSPEYKSVEKKFIDSVFSGRPEWANQFNESTLKVTKIERVQNMTLYHMYTVKKALIDKQNPPNTQNEQELWCGGTEKSLVSINVFGFNRSYCKHNSKDAWWGDGVYFSKDASCSARGWLSSPDASGEYNIYLCKVLTGVHCHGQRNMRVLPIRQDGTMLNYDSATDSKYKPVVEYVIFNDTQAYPQYCIKFKY